MAGVLLFGDKAIHLESIKFVESKLSVLEIKQVDGGYLTLVTKRENQHDFDIISGIFQYCVEQITALNIQYINITHFAHEINSFTGRQINTLKTMTPHMKPHMTPHGLSRTTPVTYTSDKTVQTITLTRGLGTNLSLSGTSIKGVLTNKNGLKNDIKFTIPNKWGIPSTGVDIIRFEVVLQELIRMDIRKLGFLRLEDTLKRAVAPLSGGRGNNVVIHGSTCYLDKLEFENQVS